MGQDRIKRLKAAYADQPSGLALIEQLERFPWGTAFAGHIGMVFLVLDLNARLGPLPEADAEIEICCQRLVDVIFTIDARFNEFLRAQPLTKMN